MVHCSVAVMEGPLQVTLDPGDSVTHVLCFSMLLSDSHFRKILIGITSWSVPLPPPFYNEQCTLENPTVFVRVSEFIQWIKQKTAGSEVHDGNCQLI